MFLRSLLLVFLLVFVSDLFSQFCSNPGQTPGSAFPVCGSSVFSQTTVPDCDGRQVPVPCGTPGIVYTDKNPFWYKFTCFTSGPLTFVITPNNLADDYDWQLFDVTGQSPGAVYTNSSLFVACNWSGNSGKTGTSSSGTSLINCGGTGIPTFSSQPNLIKGHEYLLMVSHFDDGTQSGYSLTFGGGASSAITDTTAPRLKTADISCDGTRISIKLNKRMKCSSLMANGGDFILSTGAIMITSAAGIGCGSGFDMDSLVITLDNPIGPGTHSIKMRNGTDGNTILDNCNNGIPAGDSLVFTVNYSPAALIDSIRPVSCSPDELFVVLNAPVLCSSIDANGSDFTVTGPAPVTIASATGVCSGGVAKIVKLKLSAPVYKGGSYQVAVQTGSDGNTLQTVCLVQTPVGDNKSFITRDSVSANFTYVIRSSCTTDTVTFSSGNGNGITSWNWTFDNTITSTVQNPVNIYTTAGSHTAKLVVTNGFCSDTVTAGFTVNPAVPITSTTSKVAASCGNSNGSATVTASGGAPPFSYLWSPGNLTTASISNLAPGTYTVTITDSKGCTKTDQVIVDSIPGPSISTMAVFNVSCNGGKDGKITATVSSGTAPYSYSWTDGTKTYTGNPIQNLGRGSYRLTVTDARGCTASISVSVSEPSPLSHTTSSTGTSCGGNNGSASVLESGGTSPYTYAWSPAGGVNASISNMPAGNYVVKITDSKGCIDTAHVQVASSVPVVATVTNISNVTCNGTSDGSATVAATGTGPFNYLWSPSGGTNATATNLASGNYVATITDSKGCFDTVHVNIPVKMTLGFTITNKNVSCFGGNDGSATVAATGNGPFVYTWSPITGSTAVVNNLTSGTYNVSVKDANGCVLSKSTTITEPLQIITTITPTPTTCGFNNGSATVNAMGGTGTFQYLWSPGGVTTNTISNVGAGNYTLKVTDQKGCSKTDAVVIPGIPKPEISSINGINISCSGGQDGSATATVVKGTPPYSYLWTNRGQTFTTETIQNLKQGEYILKITDANGCIATDTTTINEPAPLTVIVTTTATTCGLNNGAAQAIVDGGTTPYAYTWSSGDNNNIATKLSPGNYNVVITDSSGCEVKNDAILIRKSEPLVATLGRDITVCPGNGVSITPGSYFSYTWQDGSHTPSYIVLNPGAYSVTVTDSIGCKATAVLNAFAQCQDILFPEGFTPNGDHLNDNFGPLGTLSAVKDFTLRIYSRWGQPVFTSADPYFKWDGKIKGVDAGSGTYVWIAEYSFNSQPKQVKKGTVVLIK